MCDDNCNMSRILIQNGVPPSLFLRSRSHSVLTINWFGGMRDKINFIGGIRDEACRAARCAETSLFWWLLEYSLHYYGKEDLSVAGHQYSKWLASENNAMRNWSNDISLLTISSQAVPDIFSRKISIKVGNFTKKSDGSLSLIHSSN